MNWMYFANMGAMQLYAILFVISYIDGLEFWMFFNLIMFIVLMIVLLHMAYEEEKHTIRLELREDDG